MHASCWNRVRRSTLLKPLAIQVILPDWWPVMDQEAIDFLKRAVDVGNGIPVILPPHAKRVLAPEELGRICAAVPGVVGAKVADGDRSNGMQKRASTFLTSHSSSPVIILQPELRRASRRGPFPTSAA